MMIGPNLSIHRPRSGSDGARSLVRAGALDALLTLTRAQAAGIRATAADDTAFRNEFLADQARFAGGAVVGRNEIRNPRGEFAVAPSFPTTTPPINWNVPSNTLGITAQIVGAGVEDDIDYVDYRYFGTATANYFMFVTAESAAQIVAATGEVWTGSAFVRLMAGTIPGTFSVNVSDRNGVGLNLAGTSVAYAPTNAPLASQRISATRTLANAATVRVATQVGTTILSGSTVDFTLRVGWPQLERSATRGVPTVPSRGQRRPSVSFSGGRLLIETQRTNGLRNPRYEGGTVGVIGSGGVAPTNMSLPNIGGVALEIVGFGTDAGIPYMRLRASGTSANTTAARWQFEANNVTAAALGQAWTHSGFVRTVAGSPTGLNTQIEVREFTSGVGGNLNGTVFAASASWQRFSHTRTLADAGTTHVAPTMRFAFAATGTVFDWTFDIGMQQIEQAPFASTPILPPAAAPAASTRNADLISATLASLGVTGPCTILWSGVIPQTAPSGLDLTIITLDDGTLDNRVRLRNASGGVNIRLGRVTAGAVAEATDLGNTTPGTPFRVGITYDALGRVAGSLNGGTVQEVLGAPTGLTTLRLGNNSAASSALQGETGTFIVLPYAVSNAALAARVAALPL